MSSSSSTPRTPSSLWTSSPASSSATSFSSHSNCPSLDDTQSYPTSLDAAALRAQERRRLRRTSSWASIVASSTLDEEDNLGSLGQGAADLLQHLESPSRSPPRRVFNGRDERRIVEGPRRQTRRTALFGSTSSATLKATRSKRLSFTSTDVAELDIDILISSFDDYVAERDLELAVVGWRGERDAEETPTPRAVARSGETTERWTNPLARPFLAREASVGPRRALTSSASSSSLHQVAASLPYADLFPVRNAAAPVFPSRKKSTQSLRTSVSCTSLSRTASSAPPPPLPTSISNGDVSLASRYPFLLSSPFPPAHRTPEKNRGSVASTSSSYSSPSSSYSSPSGSTRSSVLSSADSFRWSVASGSTAGTIPECEDATGTSPTVSCRAFPMVRRGSAATTYSRMSRDCLGYEDFLREIADDDEAAPATFNSPPPSTSSPEANAMAAAFAPAFAGKKDSLQRIRSFASLNPTPSIPPRTVSLLKKKRSEKDKVRAQQRMLMA